MPSCCWKKATRCTASSGARRRSTPSASTIFTATRICPDTRFFLHYGDLTDATNLIRIMQEVQPTEIYNLAAQSHVQVSFETPEYTANADALGTLRLLEGIRILGLKDRVRFYQASTSELYGEVQETPQSETTPFYPRSPYAAAKLYAYWITVNYREAYGLHASNGILFNHEGPAARRNLRHAQDHPGRRRHSSGQAGLSLSRQPGCATRLGSRARLCRGHVADAATAQPDDYVLATGESHSVREFAELAFAEVGIAHRMAGAAARRSGLCKKTKRTLVRIDPRYFRPTEVEKLIGNPAKARGKLGWKHRIGFRDLVREMMATDLKLMAERPASELKIDRA